MGMETFHHRTGPDLGPRLAGVLDVKMVFVLRQIYIN